MLPDIKISLPIIFLVWCVAAWVAFDGPVMLAYPAMWLAVGLAFWAIDRAYRASRPAASSPEAVGKTGKKVDTTRAAEPSGSFDPA